jgi:hypothetical protein
MITITANCYYNCTVLFLGSFFFKYYFSLLKHRVPSKTQIFIELLIVVFLNWEFLILKLKKTCRMRRTLYSLFLFLLLGGIASAQGHTVTIVQENGGNKLKVDGKDVFLNGMNWDYFPIGTNFNYSLWNQSGDVIKAALDNEMALLKNMGVNVIRQYTGVPAKWIEYIYKNYGIYTMLNHSFGRYGLNVNGKWEANTDYSNPGVKALLLKEVTQMVQEYRNTPGIIFFLLGNENNYGLFWKGAETEDIPMENRESTIAAGHMYKLFNEAAVAMKKVSAAHPISICNGDLLFLDIINRECKDVDILGINVYRGMSFGDLFSPRKGGIWQAGCAYRVWFRCL